jgi:hypothetical protein
MGATEELLECDFCSYIYITDPRGLRLVHSTESSSKNAAFNLNALVVANVEEGILLHKELIKDFVTVPLVLVATSFDWTKIKLAFTYLHQDL